MMSLQAPYLPCFGLVSWTSNDAHYLVDTSPDESLRPCHLLPSRTTALVRRDCDFYRKHFRCLIIHWTVPTSCQIKTLYLHFLHSFEIYYKLIVFNKMTNPFKKKQIWWQTESNHIMFDLVWFGLLDGSKRFIRRPSIVFSGTVCLLGILVMNHCRFVFIE